MTYYVMIIAPMDSGYVGPFTTSNRAYDWAHNHERVNPTHETRVLTKSELDDNISEHGEFDWSGEPFVE